MPLDRSKISQGGLQIAAICWTIGIGILSSLAVGLIFYFSCNLSTNEVFNDSTFAEVADEDNDVKDTPEPANYHWSFISSIFILFLTYEF